MTILVTGVAGFIGSNFVYYYLRKYKDRKIIGLDKLTYAGNLDNLSKLSEEEKKRFVFIRGDINDRKLLEEIYSKYEIDGIINFAAESHVDRSIHDPGIFVKTNVLGTQTLLHVFKEHYDERKKQKFLQISTDEVYGALGPTGYFTEETPLDPHSPYSASKASSDLIVKAYHDTYGLNTNITRCSNNYGPYQFPEKLFPLMIHNALNHKELPVYGDGKHVRDWLYVEDHCKAIDLVFEKGKKWRGIQHRWTQRKRKYRDSKTDNNVPSRKNKRQRNKRKSYKICGRTAEASQTPPLNPQKSKRGGWGRKPEFKFGY